MEYVIAHSFSQFQHERELPRLEARAQALEVRGAGALGPGALGDWVGKQAASSVRHTYSGVAKGGSEPNGGF